MGPNNTHNRHCCLSTATMVMRKRQNINVIGSLPSFLVPVGPPLLGYLIIITFQNYTHTSGVLYNAVRSSNPSVRLPVWDLVPTP